MVRVSVRVRVRIYACMCFVFVYEYAHVSVFEKERATVHFLVYFVRSVVSQSHVVSSRYFCLYVLLFVECLEVFLSKRFVSVKIFASSSRAISFLCWAIKTARSWPVHDDQLHIFTP